MLRNVLEKRGNFHDKYYYCLQLVQPFVIADLASVYLKQAHKTYFEEVSLSKLIAKPIRRQTSIRSEALRRRGLQLQHTT